MFGGALYNYMYLKVVQKICIQNQHSAGQKPRGGGGTPYNGLYGEAPPERGTLFRLHVGKGRDFTSLGI